MLCQNNTGYINLSELLTCSYLEGQKNYDEPVTQFDWLKKYNEGLLAISTSNNNPISKCIINDNYDGARKWAQLFSEVFENRFYMELQRLGKPNEDIYIQNVIKLSEETNIPVVATNDVRFLNSDDFEAHEARVCIHNGYTLNDTRRPHEYRNTQYFRESEEMYSLFEDIPEAIENTNEIAKRCNITINIGEYYLPDFPVPDTYDQNTWLSKGI